MRKEDSQNSKDIGKVAGLSAEQDTGKNCREKPRKGEKLWLSMTYN
jgi:hypothetical protein